MGALVTFTIDSHLYLRDPESTNLGRKIVSESIELIDELGFEAFTFKKLAAKITSTEASVYRYFSSKHQLLSYLITWYWNWVDHGIEIRIANVSDAKKKLKITLKFIAEAMENDPTTYMNEGKLHRIVLREASKLETKSFESEEESARLLSGLDLVVTRIASILKSINPRVSQPRTLAVLAITSLHRLVVYARATESFIELSDKDHQGDEVMRYVEKMLF